MEKMNCQWLVPNPEVEDELVKCDRPATTTRRFPIAFGGAGEINLCAKHAAEHDSRQAKQRSLRRGGRR